MDIMNLGITSVSSITIICFLLSQALKALSIKEKWLPIFCGVLGGALGATALYTVPGFPAEELLTAIAIGIASGLAATGIHQVYKQSEK